MVDFPLSFLLLSTWTWHTFLTLKGTQGFYLNHVQPPRLSKSYRVDGTAGFILAQPATWQTTLCPSSSCPPGLGLTLRGTQGFYLNHVLPPRPPKSYRVDGTAGYIVAQPATWWTALCPSSCYPPGIFFGRQVKGTILKLFYFHTFFVGPLLHA